MADEVDASQVVAEVGAGAEESKSAAPASLADVTAQWLESVLAPGRPIASFEAKPVVGDGDEIAGFATDTARITVTLADIDWSAQAAAARAPKFPDGVIHLYAKFPYSKDDERREGLFHQFGREVQFYTTLAPTARLSIAAPRVALAAPTAIVLYDEVKPFNGARRVGDQLDGCSRAEASLIIRQLAALHGRFWRSKHLELPVVRERSVKTFFGNPAAYPHIARAIAGGIAAHAAMLKPGDGGEDPIVPNSIPVQAFDHLAETGARVLDLAQLVMPRVNTLVHSDVRLDNMVLGTDELILLDWQAYCEGWNVSDVAQFMIFNLNHAKCRVADVERELLEEYRAALLATPGLPEADAATMTAEALYNDYRLAVAFMAVGDCMAWMEQARNFEAGKRGDELFPTPRMTRLATSISTNIAEAFVRNDCRAVVDAAPRSDAVAAALAPPKSPDDVE